MLLRCRHYLPQRNFGYRKFCCSSRVEVEGGVLHMQAMPQTPARCSRRGQMLWHKERPAVPKTDRLLWFELDSPLLVFLITQRSLGCSCCPSRNTQSQHWTVYLADMSSFLRGLPFGCFKVGRQLLLTLPNVSTSAL